MWGNIQKHSFRTLIFERSWSQSPRDLNAMITGMKAANWIKRLGFWGFLFFLVKGLLWLLVPALIAFWTTS